MSKDTTPIMEGNYTSDKEQYTHICTDCLQPFTGNKERGIQALCKACYEARIGALGQRLKKEAFEALFDQIADREGILKFDEPKDTKFMSKEAFIDFITPYIPLILLGNRNKTEEKKSVTIEEYRGYLTKGETHYAITNTLGLFRREFDGNEDSWERQIEGGWEKVGIPAFNLEEALRFHIKNVQ